MDKEAWGAVQAAISASIGLAGVWLGGHLTNQRERTRQKEERRQAATFLATLVLAHLDRFVEECLDVAYDNGTSEGRPAGGNGYYEITVSTPVFDPLSMEVDWKAIPADLMYELLNLPHRINELQRFLNAPGFDDPPDFADYFWTRQFEYTQLGLDVIALAAKLRSFAELPAPAPGPHGQPREVLLRERQQHLADVRRTVEEHRAALMSMAPPAPPATA